MSKFMLRIHVHAACPNTCCVSMSTRYVYSANVYLLAPVFMSTLSMETDIQHGHINTAWTKTCSMDRHHEYGHAAGTWSCSIDMHLYGNGHETWTGCVSNAMLHAISILHVHVHAACLSQCCMFKSMQHRYGHAAWTWTRRMDIHMQHRHGHAAWTCNVAWIWT